MLDGGNQTIMADRFQSIWRKQIVLFSAHWAQRDNKCYKRFTSKRENVHANIIFYSGRDNKVLVERSPESGNRKVIPI